MLTRLFPLLFCVVAPLTSFLSCGFWAFSGFFFSFLNFSPLFFFLNSLRGTFYASFLLALHLGLSFPSADLVPVPGLLSP